MTVGWDEAKRRYVKPSERRRPPRPPRRLPNAMNAAPGRLDGQGRCHNRRNVRLALRGGQVTDAVNRLAGRAATTPVG